MVGGARVTGATGSRGAGVECAASAAASGFIWGAGTAARVESGL